DGGECWGAGGNAAGARGGRRPPPPYARRALMQGRRASAGLARAATLFGLGAGHETSRSTRRENDGSAHPRRQSDHRLGNIEPREDAGRLALSARPAMRLGQLSEWNVSQPKAEIPTANP